VQRSFTDGRVNGKGEITPPHESATDQPLVMTGKVKYQVILKSTAFLPKSHCMDNERYEMLG